MELLASGHSESDILTMIVEALRAGGDDVRWARADLAGASDVALSHLAESAARSVLTLDKDCWQIAVRCCRPLTQSGVVLFRVHPATKAPAPIGHAAILQGHRVLYREAHVLLEELADAVAEGRRKRYMAELTMVPLLIIDDFGMRKLPLTAAEDLLEIVMRRYERASTLLTSNRVVEDWGKLLGDTAAVGAMLDRLLPHGHVLKCGPRSWRTKTAATTE